MGKSSVLNISHLQWFGTSTEDMSSDVQFCTSWDTSLNHMYKLMSHQHVEVEETLTVAEINQCSVSIKKSHGWNQTKFGNFYIPGTSGKKWVCERDERKKSKTKKEEQLEKNQCYRSQWSRRTTEDLGRLLKLTFFELSAEFQRGLILDRKMVKSNSERETSTVRCEQPKDPH